jgi:hypothetical protein
LEGKQNLENNHNQSKMKKEEIEASFPIIIVYIGLSLMFLGIITIFTEVPKEFLIGASLSGMFFAIADFILLKSNFSNNDVHFTMLTLFLGVASFFLLPVFMIIVPNLSTIIGRYGDFASLLALGIVVSGLGYRALTSNKRYVLEIKKDMKNFEEQRNEIQKQIELYNKEHQEMKEKTLKSAKDLEELNEKLKLAEQRLEENEKNIDKD